MTQMHEDKKLDIIAHALSQKGISVWHGIPEHIVQQLEANGYKIKKSKKFKSK